MPIECCDHSKEVEKIKSILVCDETLYDVAELFKAFADTTRIKIIAVLKEEELCVGAISELINVSQSAVSQSAWLRITNPAQGRGSNRKRHFAAPDCSSTRFWQVRSYWH